MTRHIENKSSAVMPVDRFRMFLIRKGLNFTSQREQVLRILFTSPKHLTADQIFREAKRRDPQIGAATVYRTLKLLSECGLAESREFRGSSARYEAKVLEGGGHHDHLICLGCGRIVEFTQANIEDLQQQIARSHEFTLIDHRLELYGTCARCQSKSGSRP